MGQETHKETDSKGKVLEQRVKPTVIRRRAKKLEEPSVPSPDEVVAAAEAQEKSSPPAEVLPETSVSQSHITPADPAVQVLTPATIVTRPSSSEDKLGKPSDAERKIGVVGYINLGQTPAGAPIKVKEDWRDRMKRGPKKRRSRAELDMEAIQRAGGLKQFAGQVDEEVNPEGQLPSDVVTVAAVGERVFQPVPSSRKGKRKMQRREFQKTPIIAPKATKKVIRMEEVISVAGLSQATGIRANEIIAKLMALGTMATINQHIDVETASLIAGEFGFTVEHTAFKEEDVLVEAAAKVSVANLIHRAPVVTVMGHVDHGKTSILDAIRKAKVAAGEAGGITQHIGAYEVTVPKGRITFLDTPGHAAFTMMRSRGAQATDIVILVVAADDGIMPQTIEAIDHAKAAGVPIIVAINKIDKKEAQPDRVKKGLSEQGLMPEDWGGGTICVPTSAKSGEGIDHLLEMILLQAEVLELKADTTIRPKGIVIESRLDKGRGPVATVLIQEGTLRTGQYVVCGTFDGKIRAMFDATGKIIDEAGPSTPVEINGLSGVPSAGDEMIGVTDERGAKVVAEQRRDRERERGLIKPVHISLEDLSARMVAGESKELGIILKADVQGSLEAVGDALVKLSTDAVKLRILHSGVGGITESDVMLASASDAIVFGFNVLADGKAKAAAEQEGVEVRSYRIIYEMIDEVRRAMEGLLAPDEKEVWLGRAQVREVFKISKVGQIAGCFVTSGKIQRNARVRLLRDQAIVFDGKLSSLKRFKDDAKEVAEGFECGMGIENFNDIKQDDEIKAYIIEKTAAKL